MKKLLTSITMTVGIILNLNARSTVVANSGGYVDVSNAVAQAGFGGTVWIPTNSATGTAGSNVWQTPFVVGSGSYQLVLNGVSLLASNPVSIVFATNSDIGLYIEAYGAFVTISNLVFDANTSTGPNKEVIGIDGTNVCFRMTHCTLLHPSVTPGNQFGVKVCTSIDGNHWFGPWGVVDNCNFSFPNEGAVFNYFNCRVHGCTDHWCWSNSMTWGTTNCLVFENDNFYQPSPTPLSGLIEGDGGERICIRYCNITNVPQSTHGYPWEGAFNSMCQMEFYMNNHVMSDTNGSDNVNYFFLQRGGSSMIYSNTFRNQMAGNQFAVSQWGIFEVECAANALWSGGCASQLTYPTYYPAYQQVGQGVTSPNTIGLTPIYLWGNTYPSVQYDNFTLGFDSGDQPFVQQGRDIYTNTVAPGYAALVYPYPFVAQSQPASSSFTGYTGLLTH